MEESPPSFGDDLTYGISKNRIGGLIDGVYAIAMTLLVMSLEVPNVHEAVYSGPGPGEVITRLLPDITHYCSAFVILAGFWYLHHQRFHVIRIINRKILAINLVSLLFVALIPFTTNIAGNYPLDALSSIIFSTNILIIGLLALCEWRIMNHDPFLIDPVLFRQIMRFEGDAALVIPVIAVLEILIAWIGVIGHNLLYFTTVPIFAWLYYAEVREQKKSKTG